MKLGVGVQFCHQNMLVHHLKTFSKKKIVLGKIIFIPPLNSFLAETLIQ
jgi:hypothetical protein